LIAKAIFALVLLAVIVWAIYGLAKLAVKFYFYVRAENDTHHQKVLQDKAELKQIMADLQKAADREKENITQ